MMNEADTATRNDHDEYRSRRERKHKRRSRKLYDPHALFGEAEHLQPEQRQRPHEGDPQQQSQQPQPQPQQRRVQQEFNLNMVKAFAKMQQNQREDREYEQKMFQTLREDRQHLQQMHQEDWQNLRQQIQPMQQLIVELVQRVAQLENEIQRSPGAGHAAGPAPAPAVAETPLVENCPTAEYTEDEDSRIAIKEEEEKEEEEEEEEEEDEEDEDSLMMQHLMKMDKIDRAKPVRCWEKMRVNDPVLVEPSVSSSNQNFWEYVQPRMQSASHYTENPQSLQEFEEIWAGWNL